MNKGFDDEIKRQGYAKIFSDVSEFASRSESTNFKWIPVAGCRDIFIWVVFYKIYITYWWWYHDVWYCNDYNYKDIIQMIDEIINLTGSQLENIVYRLFTAYYEGFTDDSVNLVGKSGDYGVDVIATSSDEVTYAVQAKAYSGSVGLAAVQQIVAAKAMYHYDQGMVVTNSFLTKNAHRLARANNITVIEGPELSQMLLKMNGR